MKRVLKYTIPAILIVIVSAISAVFVDACIEEERHYIPLENYYITVEKQIKSNFKGVYRKVFGDRNDVHLSVATQKGINPDSIDFENSCKEGKLEYLQTSRYYALDELTHSHPYLVPYAKARLEELGKAFCDKLAERGGGSHRFVVTSVLRLDKDIKRLRRRNSNSTENSAHLYGTTVDISYRRFDKYNSQFIISTQDLKLLLAETLQEFKNEGKCYVKYEVKQGCFHITFR